ncbi:iron ABC transporter permease, partial [Anoxybacillus sp. LAT27]|nr:iron ABC transporter permease [Anoxybacillus sp. LAT27]
NGFTVLKWLIYLFFLVFLLVPLFSILLVSLTGEPVNLFGSLTSQKILSSTLKKLSHLSLDAYSSLFEGTGYFAALVNSLKLST